MHSENEIYGGWSQALDAVQYLSDMYSAVPLRATGM